MEVHSLFDKTYLIPQSVSCTPNNVHNQAFKLIRYYSDHLVICSDKLTHLMWPIRYNNVIVRPIIRSFVMGVIKQSLIIGIIDFSRCNRSMCCVHTFRLGGGCYVGVCNIFCYHGSIVLEHSGA